MPYDAWARLLTGRSLADVFSFQRNHYDGLVHFAFGLFFTRPAFEIFSRRFGLSATLARYMSIESILRQRQRFIDHRLVAPAESGAPSEASASKNAMRWHGVP